MKKTRVNVIKLILPSSLKLKDVPKKIFFTFPVVLGVDKCIVGKQLYDSFRIYVSLGDTKKVTVYMRYQSIDVIVDLCQIKKYYKRVHCSSLAEARLKCEERINSIRELIINSN